MKSIWGETESRFEFTEEGRLTLEGLLQGCLEKVESSKEKKLKDVIAGQNMGSLVVLVHFISKVHYCLLFKIN